MQIHNGRLNKHDGVLNINEMCIYHIVLTLLHRSVVLFVQQLHSYTRYKNILFRFLMWKLCQKLLIPSGTNYIKLT